MTEPVIERIPEEELTEVQDHAALRFLEEVTKEMGLDLDIKAKAGRKRCISIYRVRIPVRSSASADRPWMQSSILQA